MLAPPLRTNIGPSWSFRPTLPGSISAWCLMLQTRIVFERNGAMSAVDRLAMLFSLICQEQVDV
ncbi:hypothetical protein SMACR_12860 [Sordaria macrospora]|uniref:Uncharacterized protein n=1 Tax=Sordaria macrospora TaxID=5147 RepID=A0A8S8ZPK2_SORMA|nr:hypothetical protein SMACR_12860 [Sordaria macrospora]WPJ59127.1 hypothetical protein SMAC4_12860 [Sordaria macrospora]